LVGIDSLSEIGEDRASTDPFLSASAGRLANENTLDEDFDINGWYPQQVVRAAASKLPYNRTKVDKLTSPSLYFTKAEDTYFKREQHPSDMFSAVQQKAPYMFIDTYTGGLLASASLFLNRGTALRVYNADDIRGSGDSTEGGWRPPVRTEPRYNKVVVFRRNPDDSYAFEASANIIHRGHKFVPKNRTFYVELEDPTGDGPTKAQQLANDLASKFSRGIYKDETLIPSLDPLLMRGDSFFVEDYHRDFEASYQRRWLCWVETIKKEIINPLPLIGYSAALVLEDKIDIPTLVLSGVSGGVLETIRDPYGAYGDYFYFDDPVPSWVSEDDDYFTLDESGGTVTDNGDYFTVVTL
jgi:hypothetical protein